MKNYPIDPYAARDIKTQVDKVLQRLSNSEPPLDLREVRELLKLDRQFFSHDNPGLLSELVSKVRVGAKQLAMRPTLIIDVIRKAELKALWIPDRKRILIDKDIPTLKMRHIEAHEIAHSITPHHAPFLFGDNRETLRPSCYEQLEAEANFGASQLLFLRERFISEANDLPRTLETVRALAIAFGNTITTTLWRLVEEARPDESLFGIVSGHPTQLVNEFDSKQPCRYFIESPTFRERFSNVTEVSAFEAIQGYVSKSGGGHLGNGEVVFADSDGQRHRFWMETFFNSYDALTLGVHLGPVPAIVAVS